MNREGGGATSAGCESCGDRSTRSILHVLECEGGDRVESVPPEPENESSEGSKNSRVARHILDLASAGSKASSTGTKEDGTHECSTTTGHVDNTRAGEVNQAVGAHVRFVDPSREEAVRAPAPVHNAGVDEASKSEGVGQVGGEGATLSNSALEYWVKTVIIQSVVASL